MAIEWSKSSSGYLWVGVEVWQVPAIITPTTKTVELHADYYVEADGYGHNWTNTLHISGLVTKNVSFQFKSPKGGHTRKKIHSLTKTVSVGKEAYWAKFAASVGPIFNGGQPTVTAWHQVGAAVMSKPPIPLNLKVERTAPNAVTLSWKWPQYNDSNHLGWIDIRRRTRRKDPNWKIIYSSASWATSFVHQPLWPGDDWEYEIRSLNSDAHTDWVPMGIAHTIPDPPKNVAAQLLDDGQVLISWDILPEFSNFNYQVFECDSKNCRKIGQVSDYREFAYKPKPGLFRYKVRIEYEGGLSAFSELTPELRPLANPGPPTIVGPDGEAYPPGKVRLQWNHNSLDTSAQQKARVKYRKDGGEYKYWDTTVNEFVDIPNLGVGHYEWQVRTWGAFKPNDDTQGSHYSRVATFDVYDVPALEIKSPIEGSRQGSSKLNIEFGFSQGQGQDMGATQIELWESQTNGPKREYKKVWTKYIGGKTVRLAVGYSLHDGSSYRIKARAMSMGGLWSRWVTVNFTTLFPTPNDPLVTMNWDDDEGVMKVLVQNVPDGKTVVVHNEVWRRNASDGENDWRLVHPVVLPNTVVYDRFSPSAGEVEYRVVAQTNIPSSAVTVTKTAVNSRAVWIGGPPGSELMVPLRYEAEVSVQPSLVHKAIHYFAGRPQGVETAGITEQRDIDVTAVMADEDLGLLNDLDKMSRLPGPCIYKDPLGRCMFVSIKSVSLPRDVRGQWAVSIAMTEIAPPELEGAKVD